MDTVQLARASQRSSTAASQSSICWRAVVGLLVVVAGLGATAQAQDIVGKVDTWVTVEDGAAGTGLKAQDEAVAAALRKAVEQSCGVFLTSKTKTADYQTVYDKVFAGAVGYVTEHKVVKTWEKDGITWARVTARVSNKKFEEDWVRIAHTLHQENNPRVLVAIAETGAEAGLGDKREDGGLVQGKIEDFLLAKGLVLVDRGTTQKVNKRDIMLASVKDDVAEVAAIGARFKADVVVTGQATVKFGQRIHVAGQTLHQYVASMTVRVVRTDSAQLLVSKTYGPVTCNSLTAGGGEDKALVKLAEESAPALLKEMVEAWRKQVNVTRHVELLITGMDFKAWKVFNEEAKTIRGVQNVRRREITLENANIDIEYGYSTDNLADRLSEMKTIKLDITEISANRIKLKVAGVNPKEPGP